jgi:O-antigen ligase
MSEKMYLNILKGAILTSFVFLFFVFSPFLFPFITSKQIFFNIFIEVLLLFWLIFIYKYPKYRPQKSFLTWGIVAYFISIVLSLVISVDFNLSFWGDTERMLGFFHLFHFLLFYFIIISVFRSRKDYNLLFYGIILSSIIIAVIGFIKGDMNSTIGNRAYVAAIMLFGIFLEAFFFFKEKNWWKKIIFIPAFIISIIGLFKSDISGSQAGLIAGIFISILILIVVSKNKKTKIIGLSVLLFLVTALILLFIFRSHPVFNNTYLGKAVRDFSTENATLNTRLISYKAAGKYLIDNPIVMIFGVGHGNYATIFDKYFDPKFYDYDRVSTYFDRAHCTIIDVITTTGIIGLLSYLSIFFFIFYNLIKSYLANKKNNEEGLNRNELAIFSGLIVAYFVQNLAVFDSFATYLYFMMILGFVYFIGFNNKSEIESSESKNSSKLLAYIIIPVSLVFSIAGMVNNINSAKMVKEVIDAYSFSYSQGLVKGIEKYEVVFKKYHTGLERDARESYINLILESSDQISQYTNKQEIEKILSLGVEVAEANEKYNPNDNLILTRLAKMYNLMGSFYFNQKDTEQGNYYSNMAFNTLDRAINVSPRRIPIYLTKAGLLMNFGNTEEAIKTIEYAKSLNSNISESYCQLANVYFVLKDDDKFLSELDSCGKKGGFSLMNWESFFNSVESYYYNNKDYEHLIKFYELLLSSQIPDDNKVSILSALATVYFENGNYEKAKETALRISEINSVYKSDVDNFLKTIEEAENKK